jgi:hypothetical protein
MAFNDLEMLVTLETRMRYVAENSFMGALKNQWWQDVGVVVPTTSTKEIFSWLLSNVKIRRQPRTGGEYRMDELAQAKLEVIPTPASNAFELSADELNDSQSASVYRAGVWTRDTAIASARWPQDETARMILTNPVGYDNVTFFNTAHPIHVFDASMGTFSNDIAAKPIDATNAPNINTALDNLYSVFATIAGLSGPNGAPLNLEPWKLFLPPALMQRGSILTAAETIALPATGGAGSVDVRALKKTWAVADPVMCPELGAGSLYGTGSDTTYYVLTKGSAVEQLGASIYCEREPFAITMNNPQDSAWLGRQDKFSWRNRGRNVTKPGIPWCLFRVKAT